MEKPPNLEMVRMAVVTLFKCPNPSEKEKASQWLGDLQKSVFAWKVADQLLQEKLDMESCYFAAQTMRSKIQQSFHELPQEAHVSLRDSLLDHISQINEATSTAIVMQLCLALADLALQMPTWQKCVLDLVNRFSQTNLWPLLEIMTVLPEELESRSVRLGANRRKEVLEDLKSCSHTVLEFLRVCLASSGDNTLINTKVIRCFTSWVVVQAITLADVINNVVVLHTFHILNDNKSPIALHEASGDCVCALLQCLEDNNNQQILEIQLFEGVLSLEPAYHLSVAGEDLEKSMNYCRIFTELGESFLDKIILRSNNKNQHFSIKSLDLVLICMGHHDYEVAEITFNLWYRLSEEVYQKNSKGLAELFKPYIERLVVTLCRHAQMEPDHEGLLEDGDDFKDFRLKVYDLIKDVVFIIGSSNCFRQMFVNLQSPNVTWDTSEAALFVMQAVAKNILPEENEVVPKVVEAILNLPENTHLAVRFTSVMLLGELCDWIEQHPTSLEPILNFILYSLQQPGIAAAAATSLQSVCATCKKHMAKHIPILLQLLQQIDTFAITNNAVIGILRGTVAIVGVMPHNDLVPVFREICHLQIKPLCELIERDVIPVKGTKSDPILWLDRLASVFRNLSISPMADQVHPCRDIVTEIWPVLSSTLNKYQADFRIMERCCRCIRFMIRSINKQIRHLLEPLVEQIVVLYGVHKHSSFLYVGSILVDEFAYDNAYIQGLLDMLQAFIEPTFLVLKEENGLRNHPDTIDDFFRLCTRYIQHTPVPFLKCSALPSIIQCALPACSLDHKEANMSVMKFFYDLLDCYFLRSNESTAEYRLRKSLVDPIVQEYGQQLMTNLLHACVFYLHTYMMLDVSDVFVKLMEINRQAVGQWLENAVKSLPNQTNTGSVHATHEQMVDFHASIMRSDTPKSVSHALKDFIRLYR